MAFASGFASESTLTRYEVAHPPENKTSRLKQSGVNTLTERGVKRRRAGFAKGATENLTPEGPLPDLANHLRALVGARGTQRESSTATGHRFEAFGA